PFDNKVKKNADILRRRGDYLGAARIYRRQALSRDAEPSDKISSLCALADCMRITGRFSEARKNYRLARRLAGENSRVARPLSSVAAAGLSADDTRRFRLESLIGEALCDKAEGKYAEAIDNLKGLLTLARRHGDDEAEGFILWHIGMCLRFKGALSEALDILILSKKIFTKIRNADGAAFCMCGIGGALRADGKARASLDSYRAAGRIFSRTRDAYGRAYSLCGTANALKALGRHREALRLYRRSAAIYAKTRDFSSLAFVHKGIAGCLESLAVAGSDGKVASADIKRAMRRFAVAEALFRRSRDERGLLSLYLESLGSHFDTRLYVKACRLARRPAYRAERGYLEKLLKYHPRIFDPSGNEGASVVPKWLG
ncbi:MAG: hypothetical protein QME32_08465, partial [Endomicrobiia bacterium]|nr:hypothetical protein [Endomicrobiia bacterium]